jgi:uncharacterized protein (TIGR03435 family)
MVAIVIALTGAVMYGEQPPTEELQDQQPTSRPDAPTRADRFEVVSVRESIPDRNIAAGARGGAGSSGCIGLPQIGPGRLVFNNHSLYTMIVHAYGLICSDVSRTGLISGGADWVRSDKWVVQAVIPEGAGLQTSGIVTPFRPAISDPRLRKMLQNLLADRFKLVTHLESKEIPMYALTVAKSGAKLQHPENVPCSLGDDGFFKPLQPGQKPYCSLRFRNRAISDFIAVIRTFLDRPVIDKTGLSGEFEFRLLFSDPNRPAVDPAGPSIFTALEEQLGLKLENSKGPVEVLVIDSVSKPTEN